MNEVIITERITSMQEMGNLNEIWNAREKVERKIYEIQETQ